MHRILVETSNAKTLSTKKINIELSIINETVNLENAIAYISIHQGVPVFTEVLADGRLSSKVIN